MELINFRELAYLCLDCQYLQGFIAQDVYRHICIFSMIFSINNGKMVMILESLNRVLPLYSHKKAVIQICCLSHFIRCTQFSPLGCKLNL